MREGDQRIAQRQSGCPALSKNLLARTLFRRNERNRKGEMACALKFASLMARATNVNHKDATRILDLDPRDEYDSCGPDSKKLCLLYSRFLA